MNYTPTKWEDRTVEYPNRYKVIKDPDTGYYELTQEPGVIGKEGTPVDAEKMNNIEQGLKKLYDERFSGSYNDLTDKPTIPTKTSDLIDDMTVECKDEEEALRLSAENPTKWYWWPEA